MKKYFFIYIATALLIIACKQNSQDTEVTTQDTEFNKNTDSAATSHEIPIGNANSCNEGESLVWEGDTFASYTEDRMRGNGIVSFKLNINERLTILNEDNSSFGEIVLNEDLTYFTVTMPKKVVARKMIPNYDFASFDFDCENVNSDKEYLFIYVNKEKRKVRKTDLKFTFSTWENYIKNQTVQLKECNLITDSQGQTNKKSKNLAFTVTDVKGDEIKIKSTKDCLGEDNPFYDIKGKVKWKSGNLLLISFAVCN